MSRAKQPFVVMAKPVGSRCNMRCTYCYYLDKARYSAHEKQSCMSDELLERLIRQTIEAGPGPVVSFVWHGGEPTLAGMDFYQKAVDLQKKYLPRGWQAWNNLQTNGLLLNKSWCWFLKKNRFDVGISIDGCEAVHNANRRDLGGNPTYDRVRQSVKALQAAGVQPDLLCTVNSVTMTGPDEVYRSIEDLNCGWAQFIPIVVRNPDGGFSPESVTPEEYGRFLCRVFDLWTHNGLGRLDIQLFAEMARILAGGQPSLCWMAPECGRALVVEEDSSVYACDHFVDPEHRLGRLSDAGLGELADSPAQRAFGKSKKDGLTKQCRECPWYRFCGGGCLKDRFGVSDDGEPGHYYLCGGLKMLFAHGVPVLKKIMEFSRQGYKPEMIMKHLS